MLPTIISENNITVFKDGETLSVKSDNKYFEKIKELIREKDFDSAVNLLKTKAKKIKEYFSKTNKNISIKDNTLFFYGKEISTSLADRIIEMYDNNFDVEYLCAFLTNLYKNPSSRAVNELYTFLEKSNLPITEDGHFLAYKKVRKDYKDIHSGTFDNSIGRTVKMHRNEVDEDKDRTCSTGLHFASLDYMKYFGFPDDKIVILKINPRDVVSIPSDYNDAKGRCCKYKVVGEHCSENDSAFDNIVDDRY